MMFIIYKITLSQNAAKLKSLIAVQQKSCLQALKNLQAACIYTLATKSSEIHTAAVLCAKQV